MRNITISTDVFAALWARRQDGEDSEDAILRRVLGIGIAGVKKTPEPSTGGGVVDHRNGVTFREGFEIFRNYKGKKYVAVASSGHWRRLDTNTLYPTLNQMNAAIASGAENVWNGNWKYTDDYGTDRSIAALRTRSQ